MLPKEVWGMPPLRTFNMHASLLPQYRGAAPINWVLINGETETGVTTFFLDETIDTGNIVYAEKTMIPCNETAGELHDRLKVIGARLVLKTIETLESGKLSGISQEVMIDPSVPLKKAPKIHKENCLINWNSDVVTIHNQIRGLSPHPGAYSEWNIKNREPLHVKIYRAEPELTETHPDPGEIVTNGKKHLKIAARDGFICIKEVQMIGHKAMATVDFLNGFGRHFI